ncbi:cytochrome P450 [Pseudonocardia sp. TRM90224]|uniref:cytochrome P450 n=1 Tax=Pseudonocardia sp. TRM90224 TaxID=2812678 RepID=UPI001E5E822F|nr:cytochrome P450 [Pseudonocardia sp. TRM90224]
MSDINRTAANWIGRVTMHGLAATGDLLAKLNQPIADPWPVYEAIRDRGAVYRSRIGYAVTSHELCKRVLRGPEFGMVDSEGNVPGSPEQIGAAPSLLDLDPPDHSRLRRLVAPAFRPKLIAGYRPRIEQVAHRLLDGVDHHGPFDLVRDFATPLPITVISELLGIPEDRRGAFAEYGALVGETLGGLPTGRQRKRLAIADAALTALFVELMERRRAEPGEDVISVLVNAVDGERMSADELVSTCGLLLVAGFETTVNLIGNGVFQLLTDRDQWELLRANPALAAGAVEETLRFAPPVPVTGRTCQSATEIAGTPIPRDAVVFAVLAAANRDESVYPEPHTFDITRDGGPEHFAFSSGIHYCLGAQLARIEGEIALRVLTERMPGLTLAGRPRLRNSAAIRGYLHLPTAA